MAKTRTSKKAPRKKTRRSISPPRALEWVGGVRGYVEMLDQTRLPGRVTKLKIRGVPAMVAAIKRLSVRGAPAIGIAAAYGVVLGVRDHANGSALVIKRALERTDRQLRASRPTAVNLFWALDRMRGRALSCVSEGLEGGAVVEQLLSEARAIHREDEKLCDAIGQHAAALLRSGWGVLTHCNAGALATGGIGTALAGIYKASECGKRIRVFADETRPLLQGARLTSWELAQAGIDVTLISDSVAPVVLRRGEVQAVIVGADRIVRNGDTANKIGTYGVAVQAKRHGVPFYVAAPSTTFDRAIATGKDIPIEERAAEEVTTCFGRRTAPHQVRVYNPAFDVTPASLITAFITEHGVLRKPFGAAIRRLLGT